MDFQQMVLTLQKFWSEQDCILAQPYDMEKGAGTMNPLTFLRVLGPEPWRVAYVEPSRRPADGRYGDNPNRLFQHHQYQVIIKPSPANIQDLYLQSLAALGFKAEEHDIRTVWKSPSLPISSRSAVWISNRLPWKLRTAWNGLPCTSRAWKMCMT